MEEYMLIALKEANKSFNIGDVPVGAVIVKNDKIISQAHNMKEKKHDPTCHAEIIAIKKACKKLKRWRLEDCELYVTMEPCLMCTGAIIQSRIKKIYYSVDNTAFGGIKNISQNVNKDILINSGLCENESKIMLKSFFESKRGK